MRDLMSLVLVLVMACALDAKLPEGRIRCDAAADCPTHWVCRKAVASEPGLCYRSGSAGSSLHDAGGVGTDAAPAVSDGSAQGLDASVVPTDAGQGGAGATDDGGASAADASARADASSALDDAAANHPPSITGIALPKRRVTQGASVSATCLASDPDGDSLHWLWSASQGSFVDASMKSVSYDASVVGKAELMCSVTDGHGGTAEDSVTVRVYPQGLVTMLPFSLDASDQSGHGNGAIIHGAAYGTDADGNTGSAMSLDGQSNDVTLENPSAYSLPSFSFVATLAIDASNHVRTILSKGTTGYGSISLLLTADDDATTPRKFVIAQDNANGMPAQTIIPVSGYTPQLGKYIQVALTRGDYGEVRLYVDGTAIYTGSGLPALAATNQDPVVLGNGPQGAYAGVIDEVQIYDRVLTTSEVQALVPLR